MKVLSIKYPGIFFVCNECGALVGEVNENEIYEDCYVYCPICRNKQRLEYSKKYNGVIENGKNE